MKIKDLPSPIKTLPKRNVEKQHGFWVRFEYFRRGWDFFLYDAFMWSNTIEGYEYWYQVDNGNFNFEPRKEVKV